MEVGIIFDYLLTLDEKLISMANHKLMRNYINIAFLVHFAVVLFQAYVITARNMSFVLVIFPSVCFSASVSWCLQVHVDK